LLPVGDPFDWPESARHLQSVKGNVQLLPPARFSSVFIKGDGAFNPLQEFMDTVYGAPQLNTTSANEHKPTAERKIRHIKERARAIIHSIPFNALPEMVLIHMVLFVAKQLNLFPVKGGLSAHFSPRQIMSGDVTDYKNCNMGFGQYC
jgi:hypothetical protein